MFLGGSNDRSTANPAEVEGFGAGRMESYKDGRGPHAQVGTSQLKGALEMGPDCPHSEYQGGLGVAGWGQTEASNWEWASGCHRQDSQTENWADQRNPPRTLS